MIDVQGIYYTDSQLLGLPVLVAFVESKQNKRNQGLCKTSLQPTSINFSSNSTNYKYYKQIIPSKNVPLLIAHFSITTMKNYPIRIIVLYALIDILLIIMIQAFEDLFFGPKIQVLILWNRQTIEAQFHKNQNIYEEIAKKLKLNFHNDGIIIITQDQKLLSQEQEFSKVSNNEPQIFTVFQISSILEVNNQMDYLIESKNAQDQLYKTEITKLKEEITTLNQKIETLQQNLERMQGKTASSFVQENYQNQNLCESSISFDLTTSKYIDALKKQKNDELTQLQRIGSQIYQSMYKSIAQPLKVNCQFCNQDIEQDLIQLNCQHFYHEQCFESLLEAQLVLNEPQFNCLCKMKIKQSELKALSNQQKVQIFQLQMNLKQLSVIKENIQDLRKCDRRFCSFFYIYDEKQKQTGKYCPLCLQ